MINLNPYVKQSEITFDGIILTLIDGSKHILNCYTQKELFKYINENIIKESSNKVKMELEWQKLKQHMQDSGFDEKQIHVAHCSFRIGWVKGEGYNNIENAYNEWKKSI